MNDELRTEIRAAVSEGIEDALARYGMETDDHNQMQADFLYLRKARTGSDEIAKWIKRSAVTVAVSSIIAALWQGIKTIIGQGG